MSGRCFLVVALLLATVVPAASAGDMIQLKNGKWLVDKAPAGENPTDQELAAGKLKVIGEEFDVVKYRLTAIRGGGVQTQDMNNVKRVVYGESDPSYTRAADMMASGDWEGALDLFERAKSSRVSWVPQYAMWNIVRIHEALGDPDSALAAIDELIKEFPKTKYLVQAHEKAALILLGKNAAQARARFSQIRRIPGVPDETARSVDYWLIYIKEVEARSPSGVESVKREYERLLEQVEGKSPTVAMRCRLGIGRCLLKLEKADEALSYFQNIVAKEKDPDILAGAYVGVGEAYFAMKKWVEARRAFLRVCVLWEESEFHAQALCRAGNCFLLAREEGYKERARYELTECIRRYPGSSWAAMARKLMP
jgi:tetratricopeptide (TPR) repeat protein